MMFERFSDHARRAMFFSRYEASRAGQQVIDSAHILLGVIRESDPVMDELWAAWNVDPLKIAAEFPAINERISSSAELPLSEDAKRIFGYTLQEAMTTGGDVEPAHLVIAMLRLPDCAAANVLARHGVSGDEALAVARELVRSATQIAAKKERTPIILRESHYALLDALGADRQAVALAIFDALADARFGERTFASLDELRDELRRRLS